MKTLSFSIAFAVSCFLTISSLPADCGKVPIVPYVYDSPLPPPADPYPLHQTVEKPDYSQSSTSSALDEGRGESERTAIADAGKKPDNAEDDGSIPPPKPTGSVAMFGMSRGTFYEANQQAIVAWNGNEDSSGEEMLILTTNEKSATGEPIAALSILPLPGRPISVERSNAKVFGETKLLFNKKLAEKSASGRSATFGCYLKTKIGSHHIFVWKIDNIDTFESEINRYIAQTYRQNAKALLSAEGAAVVRRYIDRGFRFFAFDLTLIDSKTSTKEAIAYRFKSRFAYFPLEISKIGGVGRTMVDLIVITPGPIRLSGAIDENSDGFFVVGNTSVDFKHQELATIEPAIDLIFSDKDRDLKARNFIIAGKINSFDGDFLASPY